MLNTWYLANVLPLKKQAAPERVSRMHGPDALHLSLYVTSSAYSEFKLTWNIFIFQKDKSVDSPPKYSCLISHVNVVHSDTHSFHHSETHSLSPSLCSAFQSNFHSWHHSSAYLPISVSVPEWVICKAMFTSTLRRFTQEWACQVFELSLRSVFTNLLKGKK